MCASTALSSNQAGTCAHTPLRLFPAHWTFLPMCPGPPPSAQYLCSDIPGIGLSGGALMPHTPSWSCLRAKRRMESVRPSGEDHGTEKANRLKPHEDSTQPPTSKPRSSVRKTGIPTAPSRGSGEGTQSASQHLGVSQTSAHSRDCYSERLWAAPPARRRMRSWGGVQAWRLQTH